MAVLAEAEKPGFFPDRNPYRFRVAATKQPGYIECTVWVMGRTIGNDMTSGSGTASSVSSLTIALSTMSAARGPFTLTWQTASGAIAAVFSCSGLIGM